jgi:hypothetical protein
VLIACPVMQTCKLRPVNNVQCNRTANNAEHMLNVCLKFIFTKDTINFALFCRCQTHAKNLWHIALKIRHIILCTLARIYIERSVWSSLFNPDWPCKQETLHASEINFHVCI